MKYDLDYLLTLPRSEVEHRTAAAAERAETRTQRAVAENRDFTAREVDLQRQDHDELTVLKQALTCLDQIESRGRDVDAAIELHRRGVESRSAEWQPTLLVSRANIEQHAAALSEGRPWGAVEMRSRVTAAADLGSAGGWATVAPAEPRHLISFANIPVSELSGRTAQVPQFAGPAGTPGVDESTDHPEYDDVTPVNLTAARYGRWSEVSALANQVDELIGLSAMHSWAISRSLDDLAVSAVEAAGALNSLGVSAGQIETHVREAILLVAATVFVAETNVVVVGTPADLAELTGVSPANATDLASYPVTFNGAKLYPTIAATPNVLTVFAPSAFRVFQSPLQSATQIDPQSGAYKFGSWLHSTGLAQTISGSAVWVGGS
ncbi:hypothetical protein MHPYR_10383 [uncultured Mycobacterium sp.]|uniref:Uncharacterized protein n=1 Tax=uncultured Mycobacterium sp. TaxID=171292 RepID=A0A1Y5NX35_9MYCO|nr:hypothetical protein MHPYR_10383 [uncultured Mycobacterium sp.]